MDVNHEKDLPLMANSKEFHLYHYILDLNCDLDNHVMSGQIYLFLNPIRELIQDRRIFSMHQYQKQMMNMCEVDKEHCQSNTKVKQSDLTDHGKFHESDVCTGGGACKNKNIDSNNDNLGLLNMWDENTLEPLTKVAKRDGDRFKMSKELDAIPNETFATNQAATGGCDDTQFLNADKKEKEIPVELILDAYQLDVKGVSEVLVPLEELTEVAQEIIENGKSLSDVAKRYLRCCQFPVRPLDFNVEEWCIKIWKTAVTQCKDFPRVVKIDYCTKPGGQSLRWTLDQDSRLCMFTSAMWVNNRAFFPTAEYGNLSTWQCSIKTVDGASVLMSSDKLGTHHKGEDFTVSYRQCGVPLPPFTLAIAIGFWRSVEICGSTSNGSEASGRRSNKPLPTCDHTPRCQIDFCLQETLPCNLYGPESVLATAQRVLSAYWPSCTRAIQEQLGASPFSRTDILIYPSCVQDMALSNPYLIFLSQSLLAEDGSMMMRVAHEVSHAWFGLLIGAKDWTEEWLSEGFATYMEDPIHALAMGMTEEEEVERGELRAFIRQKVLEAEVEHTESSLQTLRPEPSHSSKDTESSVMYVKNGMNPNKQFTQVHYLKGYFLLRHLACIVGVRKFNTVIRSYIQRFHGELVLSKDFLHHIFDVLPDLSEHGLSVDAIFSAWLDVPGIPVGIKEFKPHHGNKLFRQVMGEVTKWKEFDMKKRGKQTRSPRRRALLESEDKLEPDQLVLMLEELLLLPKLKTSTLKKLKDRYVLQEQNADVRHRWCELVIKHKYIAGYPDVKGFLINDQAMGVYLYGELVLSGCSKQRALAEKCFSQVSTHMEGGTRNTRECLDTCSYE